MVSSSQASQQQLRRVVVTTVALTAAVTLAAEWALKRLVSCLHTRLGRQRRKANLIEEETTWGHDRAKELLWRAIGGAMCASHIYLGDRLGLYAALRDLCCCGNPNDDDDDVKDDAKKSADNTKRESTEIGTTTAVALARRTKLNQRFLREWLAQQAASGFVELLDGDGDEDDALAYRFHRAFADVLATQTSPHYEVSLVQMVPALVQRARTTLPEAFRTGLGQGYDDADVSEAIDRAHARHLARVVFPKVLPATTRFEKRLSRPGATCAELGCGAGNWLMMLARAYPNATFVGYDVSEAALELCAQHVKDAATSNVSVRDARADPLGAVPAAFDVVTTFDVLHDAPRPEDLVRQVRRALKPGGAWLLGDIAGLATTRENVTDNPRAATAFAISTCLCLACAVSEPGGAGLGQLGFSVPVAMQMLTDHGFTSVRVLIEEDNTRWFEAIVPGES